MGERDIEKKVLELPIPRFNPDNEEHLKLSRLGSAAKEEARRVAQSEDLPSSLGRRRGLVRERLSKTLAEINEVVDALW